MKIELITPEIYEEIKRIFEEHPYLILQNNGYEYLNKSKFTSDDLEAFNYISDILNQHVVGFSQFFNLRFSKDNRIQLRFNYNWDYDDPSKGGFTGVGYILLDELLNGFEEKEK